MHYEDEDEMDELHKTCMEEVDELLAHFRTDISNVLSNLIDEVQATSEYIDGDEEEVDEDY